MRVSGLENGSLRSLTTTVGLSPCLWSKRQRCVQVCMWYLSLCVSGSVHERQYNTQPGFPTPTACSKA